MTFCKNFRSFGIIKWWLLITFFMSGMTPCFSQSSKLKLPLLWTAEFNTLLESAPTVADINNDSRDEILVAGREEIFALGKDGRELWRWRTRGRFMTYPAVLKRKGQLSLIYLADFSGLFTCLNGAGRKIWQVELNAPSDWSATVIADLDADGVSEVIQTDEKGTVWLFNALTGAVQWQTKINGKPVSPAVGDLDGDGKQEILVATNEGFLFVASTN